MTKSKSTKHIKLPDEIQTPGNSNISTTSKHIPLGSSKNIPSEKKIGLTPGTLTKNMSIKELIAARRPKVLAKVGSQKLIF